VGTPQDNSGTTPTYAPPAGGDAARNARYVYLVGRLRNRQMTMEEATELFGMMQAMLRASELGRQAALRAMATSPSTRAPAPSGSTTPTPAPAPGGIPSADDLLMLGMLGTGAAAGVLAALTKRIQELTSAPSASGGPKSDGPPS
jgi:hypothetical protein